MKPLRYLYLFHRWLGIVMCCFFAMWFFSGMVMMYVGFPSLTHIEQFDGLPTLQAKQIRHPVSALIQHQVEESHIEQLKLTTVINRPAYLLKSADQSWQGMYADNGELFDQFTKEDALHAALLFAEAAKIDTGEIRYQEKLNLDQWTVSSSLESFRPLYRIELDNSTGQQLYISTLTGQVVRDTHHAERLWNWLGSNLHWIYPVQLRKYPDAWSNVVIWLSIIGLVSLMTGSLIGIHRLRIKKPYSGNRHTPYKGIMKYHHLLGLGFLLFLFTYLFSGLMSMNPWGIFSEKQDTFEQLQRYQTNNNGMPLNSSFVSAKNLQSVLEQHPAAKEVSWHWLDGQAYMVIHTDSQQFVTLPAKAKNLLRQIESALPTLIPNARIIYKERLEEYDLYYYSHHERERPLPVLRVKFDDIENSWFHINPKTGEILEKLTSATRLQRWLFNALHSFDFNFLIKNRPVWDIWVISLSVIGFIFSATSIAIAWRRLNFHKQRKNRALKARANPP